MAQNAAPGSSVPRVTGLFLVFAALFVTVLIASNITAVKLIAIAPGLPGFLGDERVLPAAIIVFPITYILGDVLTEVYGFHYARRVICLGFLCNLVAVVVFWIGGLLPAATFWQGQEAYDTILGYTPRLLTASFIAYLVGELSNSIILSQLKLATRGRWLWTRTIGSTIVGQGVDSAVFITIAFANTLSGGNLVELVLTQWAVKVLYEVAATPITYAVVASVKRWEGFDAYDPRISFNPLAMFK